MSVPSLPKHLDAMGVTAESATPEQRHRAFILAFEDDLPLGIAHLREQAEESLATGDRVLRIEDPNSPLGKELIRLCGGSRFRLHVQQEFGIAVGFYNCCAVVVAPTDEELNMSDVEQIMLQNGQLAYADC